jgi:hypothetical protein
MRLRNKGTSSATNLLMFMSRRQRIMRYTCGQMLTCHTWVTCWHVTDISTAAVLQAPHSLQCTGREAASSADCFSCLLAQH